jgi:hypothetical protein
VSRELGQPARGWTDDEWSVAEERLEERGWLADGRLTMLGQSVRASVEQLTDELADEPWAYLGRDGTARLAALTRPIAQMMVDAEVMPLPNPIGAQWPPSTRSTPRPPKPSRSQPGASGPT